MVVRFLSALVLLSLLGLAACSISDSISSPFESSSASSRSSESNMSKFHRQVIDYTATFATGQGDFDAFMRGIGDLASRYSIANWESDPATYVAIGQGLRQAKVGSGVMEAYVTNIAKGDTTKANAIRKGYGG